MFPHKDTGGYVPSEQIKRGYVPGAKSANRQNKLAGNLLLYGTVPFCTPMVYLILSNANHPATSPYSAFKLAYHELF